MSRQYVGSMEREERGAKRVGRLGACGWRGFTMVEMLTVIAVIAILAAILFPVFASVRRDAYKASCTSNLHQIGLMLKLFKAEHGFYPDAIYPFTVADGTPAQPVTSLYPQYINDKQSLRCPLAPYHVDDPKAPAVQGVLVNPQWVKLPKRIYAGWDSYDGQFVPPNSTQYEVHYLLHWSPSMPGFTDNQRQLLYKNPPEDTVVTWCGYHRDYSNGAPQGTSIDLVLFLDGHIQRIPSNRMFPITPAAGHSFQVSRGD